MVGDVGTQKRMVEHKSKQKELSGTIGTKMPPIRRSTASSPAVPARVRRERSSEAPSKLQRESESGGTRQREARQSKDVPRELNGGQRWGDQKLEFLAS